MNLLEPIVDDVHLYVPALYKGIPPSVVMKWLDIVIIKAMKPYIDIADEVKSSYMKQLMNSITILSIWNKFIIFVAFVSKQL